ncbi:MAG: hypothetical protein ACOCPS_01740 [Desulfonatronovibrio sp.]
MKKLLSPRILICALLLFISGTALAGWFYLEHSLEKNFQSFVTAHPELDIACQDLRTNPLKQSIVLEQPVIRYSDTISLKARRLTVQDLAVQNKIPVKMTLRAAALDIQKFFPSLELTTEIERSGSKLSEISGVLTYEYHPSENRLEISRIILDNQDLGLFCANLTLSSLNIDYLMSLQNPFLLGAGLLGISIDHLQAGYEDQGMIKRLAELNGWDKQTGSSEDGQDMAPFLNGLSPDKSTPVQNFLRAGKPLSVEFAPRNPVPFSRILTSQDQEAAAKLLNLEISNQKPAFCKLPDGQ